ncbi:hypothetical protein EYF80_024103 [Liparis tanakae]|uniref:Uncharacterized protein n=1 Tax=Liparis tanakae TaxID=230148 RepID=A0A4Z2HIF2_9TELE|nr:hypothetical protein EYF80_024103 [Liparis tanakae]
MKRKTRAGMRKGRGNKAVEAKGERRRGRGEEEEEEEEKPQGRLSLTDSHQEDRQQKRRDGK